MTSIFACMIGCCIFLGLLWIVNLELLPRAEGTIVKHQPTSVALFRCPLKQSRSTLAEWPVSEISGSFPPVNLESSPTMASGYLPACLQPLSHSRKVLSSQMQQLYTQICEICSKGNEVALSRTSLSQIRCLIGISITPILLHCAHPLILPPNFLFLAIRFELFRALSLETPEEMHLEPRRASSNVACWLLWIIFGFETSDSRRQMEAEIPSGHAGRPRLWSGFLTAKNICGRRKMCENTDSVLFNMRLVLELFRWINSTGSQGRRQLPRIQRHFILQIRKSTYPFFSWSWGLSYLEHFL